MKPLVHTHTIDIPWVVSVLQELRTQSPELMQHADDPEYVTEQLELHSISPNFLSVELAEQDSLRPVAIMFGIYGGQWFSAQNNFYEQFLYIDPEYRRWWNFKKLVSHMEDRARDVGCTHLCASSGTGISDANCIKLYERMGYTQHSGVVRKRLNVH